MKNNLLNNRRFLSFYLSRTSANVADSIYMMVLLYFIQSTTESVSYTSFTYSAITATAMFSFLVGPLVDRYSPSKLVTISLLIQAVIIFSVPLLIGKDQSYLILILVLVFLASCFSLLFYPANNKMIPMLLPSKEGIVKANALINSTDQVINILGYLVGASVIIGIGMKNTFFLASGLLLLSGLIYLKMSRSLNPPTVASEEEQAQEPGSYLRELMEGFAFVNRNLFLKIMLPFYALINFLLAILIITIPSLAVDAGSPIYYSLIYIAFFMGVLGGSVIINKLPKQGIVIALAWIFMGISLGLFAIMHGIWLKMLAVLLMGLSTGVINVLQTSLIQIITPTNLLGRVMSFLTSLSNASLPFGALIGGMLALRFPLEMVLLISAILILISGIVLLLIKTIRDFVFTDEDEKENDTESAGSSGETVQV
ncbi:Predicted arabinose efflux permease, MFS family [Fontibacillus panacisegetis]|uniref:Predicted arabinose efflux permease, MFS family n=1 Tax=Fontibacillus panacisegetis TaxID=670482 RepID=A0A1G7J424_9BACL|nr:MFS transporter [Fontibacillus panacisegetis]SDF19626.1 Predicted arabinose efflux permease, MFS family [Fontibacillus panacisegetis]